MKKLKYIKKKHSGRNFTGQVTMRHQGGGNKNFIRVIDFKRNKIMPGKVESIEYDPNRNCQIALIHYPDGDKRYIIAPDGLKVGSLVSKGTDVDLKPGNVLPLSAIPMGTFVHNVELTKGKGGQLGRSAGTLITVGAKEGDFVQLKLPSSEIRRIHKDCLATIGQVGNIAWKERVFKKAGIKRHMGIRPSVRGVAMNPRSHPHGGGEARSGIGMHTPKTYAGRPAVGKTRNRKRYSNKFIIQRRKK